MHHSARPSLTPAQWLVLERLARGERDKEIAGALGLSVATIHHHLADIYLRLALKGRGSPRAAAAVWYLTVGQALREQEGLR